MSCLHPLWSWADTLLDYINKLKIIMDFSSDPVSRSQNWIQWTPDWSLRHKLIMQRRDTINSDKIYTAPVSVPSNSQCTDGAKGYITAEPPSIWLTGTLPLFLPRGQQKTDTNNGVKGKWRESGAATGHVGRHEYTTYDFSWESNFAQTSFSLTHS